MNEPLTSLTLSEAAGLIVRREISPVELTQAYLDRIAALDERLNCVITLTPDAALESARRAEETILGGEYRCELHGIPLALKDLYETAGVRTTAGSKFFADYIPQQDGACVERLAAAGAVLLGKFNMHEIALGVTNNNPHFGACHNPWRLDRIPGGSSGGCGAALAAEMCPGALGSDTGGSIRIPASLCGIVGLKPTFGRISLRGLIPLSWNLDHPGPMARRVRDAAVLLQAIAGYDPEDPSSIDAMVPDYLRALDGGVSGWRIALASDEFFTWAEGEVLSAVREAAQTFTSLGAQVQEAPFPNGRDAARANGLMVTSDAAAFHRERLENQPEDFGEDVLQRLHSGAAFTSTEYVQARRTQSVLRRQFERFFDSFDLLLTPATPVAAPAIEGPDAVEQARTLTRFTSPFNLTGLPALSLPCGFTGNGLPIGLQIVGPPWSEAAILRAAHAFEQATDWHRRRPGSVETPVLGHGSS
jgi:aspartyl-tRNA(Asn)/glutamyl-tRNA(Gln) amidotransferase subunit A